MTELSLNPVLVYLQFHDRVINEQYRLSVARALTSSNNRMYFHLRIRRYAVHSVTYVQGLPKARYYPREWLLFLDNIAAIRF